MSGDKKLTLNTMTRKDDDNTSASPIEFINNEADPVSDEISLRAIGELFEPSKLKQNSRIKPTQVANLVKLYAYADTFKASFPRKLADYLLQLQISLNGFGRKEIVQLVQQRNNGIMVEKPITSKDIFK